MANILIAGGSTGIGLEIIKSLSEQDDNVYVLTRSPEKLSDMQNVTAYQYDVENENPEMPELPKSIDGFVYAPGTVNLRPFQRFKAEDYQKDLQINLLGAITIIQAIYKNLRKSSQASIVFFSSVAVQTGLPYHASIAASKGAVEGFTRTLAAELAPNIRVNAIAPSMTDTNLASPFITSEENRQKYNDNHPLKRIGKPRDIANAALFLLSDKSSWITGEILHVDGGMSSVKFL